MKKRLFFSLLVILCLNLSGQGLLRTLHEQDSLKVVNLIDEGLYNEVFQFLSLRLEDLAEESPREPFTLWLKASRAYVLDRRALESEALKEAMEVVDMATPEASCSALADARLTIALLQEKYALGESCLEELNRVKALLEVCDLPAARSRYHVRKSSYHRWFGTPDSVAYHGEQAIRYGRQSGFLRGELDGHFMLAVASKGKDAETGYFHIRAMIDVNERMGSLRAMLITKVNLASMKQRDSLPGEALEIVNSVIRQLNALDDEALFRDPVIMKVFNHKSELLFAKGNFKEALLALKQYNQAELSYRDDVLDQRVKELEAAYQSKFKDEKIRKRERELEVEKARIRAIWLALIIATLSALALTYLVLRLRRTKTTLEEKSELLHTLNEELTSSLNEQVLLRSELHHRVKNNLQVIISLLNIQEHKTGDSAAKDGLRSMSERVYSIAAVHELLYPQESNGLLNFQEYVKMLCHHSAQLWKVGRQPEFIFALKGQVFNLDTLVPLGVMISELLTNTRKNFVASDVRPQVLIALAKLPGGLRLTYSDNGPGFAAGEMPERKGGMGKYLLQSMSRQLNGSFKTRSDGGAVTMIDFQVKNNEGDPESSFPSSVPGKRLSVRLSEQV